MKKLFLLLGLIIILSGCTNYDLNFTIISTKKIHFSKAHTFIKGKTRVKGVDKISFILLVPSGYLDLKEAIGRAIDETPGCVAIVDGNIYHESFYFGWFFWASKICC